jgi:hypothetical protein
MRVTMAVLGLFLLFIAFLTVTTDSASDSLFGLQLGITADETQLGEVRVLLTYTLTVITFLLSTLTIVLSASTLDMEIVKKQIFLVASKPVRHWQLLLGKWLGVVLLNAWLLLLMGTITIALAYYFGRPDPSRPFQHGRVKQQVLVSRASIRPPELNAELEIKKRLDALRAQGATEAQLKERGVHALLKRSIEKKSLLLHPYMAWTFKLDGIPQPERPDMVYTVRHKLYATDSSSALIRGEWAFRRPDGKGGAYYVRTESKSGTVREIDFPVGVVDEEGRCHIAFRNLSTGNPRSYDPEERKAHVVSFSIKEGLEVLAPQGNFSLNLLRGGLLLLIRLATMAAIGVAATSLLSMPVTLLVLVGFILPYGYGSTFLLSKIEKEEMKANAAAAKPDPELQAGKVAEMVGFRILKTITPISRRVTGVIAHVPPSFAATDPEDALVVGRQIPWRWLFDRFLIDLLLRGGGAFLLGLIFLNRRELGLPTS